MKLNEPLHFNLSDLRSRMSIPRSLVSTVSIVCVAFLLGFLLYGAWSFYEYETSRLIAPRQIDRIVPVLDREAIDAFAKRVQSAPPPPTGDATTVPTASPLPEFVPTSVPVLPTRPGGKTSTGRVQPQP